MVGEVYLKSGDERKRNHLLENNVSVPASRSAAFRHAGVSVSRVRNPVNFHSSSLPAEASAQAGAPSGHGTLAGIPITFLFS
jgi:hypothetical protein